MVKNPPANARSMRDSGLIPVSGSSLGGARGNPLQYSCLENHMDRGAWWATVHGGCKESDITEHTHREQSPLFLRLFFWSHVNVLPIKSSSGVDTVTYNQSVAPQKLRTCFTGPRSYFSDEFFSGTKALPDQRAGVNLLSDSLQPRGL